MLTDLGHVDDHHLGGPVLHGEQLHVERELGAHKVVRLRRAEESVVARAVTRSDRSREPVGALRTGVTVAQALTNQKLVLDQISALNTTTAGVIDSTSEMLKNQTGQIHEQAASSTIPLETLQRAFQNVYDTMDNIDTFKLKALENMKTTVNSLSGEIEKSKGYIARSEGQAKAQLEAPSENPLTALEE